MFGKMKKIERKWMVLLLIFGIVLVGNSAAMNSLPANAETTIEESNNAQTETSETEVTPTEEPLVQEEEEEEIVVAKPEKTKITYGKCKKAGTYTIKWKKVDCDGYEIDIIERYKAAVGNDVGNAEDGRIVSSNISKKTLKVSDTTKYVKVRIRTFNKDNGKKLYSSWSTRKKINIKRRKYKNEPKIGNVVTKKSKCKKWRYYPITPMYKWNASSKTWSFDYYWRSVYGFLNKKDRLKKNTAKYLNNKNMKKKVMSLLKPTDVADSKKDVYWWWEDKTIYLYLGDGKE